MSRRKNDLSQRLEAVIKTLVPQQEQNPDDLGPMMRAIKAVHSISDHTSTTPEDLERQRAAEELFARLVTPGIGIRSDSLTVGSIPAEWVSLEHGHDRRHAVLYCHGGGYTCGQLGYARILASKLALATGFDVLSFEYRLAPEHPFPAAIEDAVAMWDYLMYMGYGARDVIVAGDSAGGNLALELALKLKEQGRGPETSVRCKKSGGNQRQKHHPQDAYGRIGHRSQVQFFHACLPVYHGNTSCHRSQEEKPERNIGPGCEQVADKARKQHHSGSCPQDEFEQEGHASCRFLEKGADG